MGAGAVSAEDSGWELELPQMLFPSVHLLRQGEEGEGDKRRKTELTTSTPETVKFFAGILVQNHSC